MENLAQKYRPATLADMTEQSIIVDIVKKMGQEAEITRRNLLFVGPAGTGKTTISRCIARMVNGEDTSNIIEVDAASHSGVDSMRELIAQMNTYPVGAKYKFFIIDECHSLSSQAWQSLLKTLEEQPARSIVCLCTTNPEKIPNTILSRVQKFQLSKISLEVHY